MAKKNDKPVAQPGKQYVAKRECCIGVKMYSAGAVVPLAPGDFIPVELVEEMDTPAAPESATVSNPVAMLLDRIGLAAESLPDFSTFLTILAEENKCDLGEAVNNALAEAGAFEAAFKAWMSAKSKE